MALPRLHREQQARLDSASLRGPPPTGMCARLSQANPPLSGGRAFVIKIFVLSMFEWLFYTCFTILLEDGIDKDMFSFV